MRQFLHLKETGNSYIRVCDPGLDKDDVRALVFDDVRPGFYSFVSLGNACMFVHLDYISHSLIDLASWDKMQDASVINYTGQIGIFNDDYYPKNTGSFKNPKSFYRRCCDISLADNGRNRLWKNEEKMDKVIGYAVGCNVYEYPMPVYVLEDEGMFCGIRVQMIDERKIPNE